ncbi:cyclase/dehydrase family protein [Diplocarpon rosae]|nr:cyclase/dehydrase family protein [Diplocarpon rosae]
MSKTLLRAVRPASTNHSLRPIVRRNFITIPGTEAQRLTATRILPYNSTNLYALIADVDSYSSFLPYCQGSKVTEWSKPDRHGKRWPSGADLRVGWGGYEETFTSRLFCIPGSTVEALGGEAKTSLSRADLGHHAATLDAPAVANNIFQTIRTVWTVKPFHYKPPPRHPQTDKTDLPAEDHTEVHLSIDYQFSNPIYAALSKAVAPRIAGIMIEAFELRAQKMLDSPGSTTQESHQGE